MLPWRSAGHASRPARWRANVRVAAWPHAVALSRRTWSTMWEISYMPVRSSVARGGPIPSVIKRNTFLLAATQAFVGMGTQMVPTMGAIIVTQMVGTAYLVGLAASLQNVSRFVIAY